MNEKGEAKHKGKYALESKSGNKKPMDIKSYQVFLLILFLSFLFYGNSLKNQYSLDDHYVIVNKPVVEKGIAGLPKIFTSHYIDSNLEKHSYRPITTASFAIEYQFFGANPFVSHLINILLYAFCCFLVYKLIISIAPRESAQHIAILTALIFLLLPIHSEVVNNVKSRDELLTFSFGFLAIFQFLKHHASRNYHHFLFGVLLLLLSLLAKLTTITLIAIIPLMLFYLKKEKIKKYALIFPLLLTPFILLKLIKNIFIKSGPTQRDYSFFENPLFDESYSFFDRIPVAISTVGDYLLFILYPEKLISYYGYNEVEILSWGDAKVWIYLFVIIGLISIIIYCWKRSPLISFGLMWFFISISMFTNLVKPVVGIIAERFVFFPSVGICIAIATLIHYFTTSQFHKKHTWSKWTLILVCTTILGLSWQKVINRNPDWFDKITLYKSDVKKATQSAKLHSLYANMLLRELGKKVNQNEKMTLVNEATHHYKECVKIYPQFSNSWNNLATMTLNELQNPQQALLYYKNAIKYEPNYTTALFGAGYACELMNNFDEALKYYNQVVMLDPSFQNVQKRIEQISTQ